VSIFLSVRRYMRMRTLHVVFQCLSGHLLLRFWRYVAPFCTLGNGGSHGPPTLMPVGSLGGIIPLVQRRTKFDR